MIWVVKSIFLILTIPLLCACSGITPEAVSTLTVTRAAASASQTGTPSMTGTPVHPTPTPSSEATSTLTSVLPTSSATPQRDPVEETREAEAFCYQDPRKALDDYLTFLYQGEFEKAARLYGSPYPFEERLITPEALEPSERLVIVADFLQGFCRGYATCLEHKIISEEILSDRSRLIERIRNLPEGEVIIFEVEFYQKNGEILEVVIPTTNGFESYTTFELIVAKLDGCYKNLRTPPITA